MTEKELRRLGRRDLIEIIALLKKRELELEEQLESTAKQLEERNSKISNAGSIAQEALVLSGVFEAAQAAADTYLSSLKAANADKDAQLKKTQEECERLLAETERQCKEKLEAADAEIQRRTALFNKKIDDFMQAHPELWGAY